MIPAEIKRIATSYFQKQKLPIHIAIKNNSVEISSSKDFNQTFQPRTRDGFALSLTSIRHVDKNGFVIAGFEVADALTLGKYKGHLTKLLNVLYNHLRSDYYFDQLILKLDSNENQSAWQNIANKLNVHLS